MKKLWFFFAMFVCVLASCSDGGSDDPSNPTPKPDEVKAEITIDSSIVTNGLSFSTSGGEQSVSFSVNANWALSVASTSGGSTWCKPSATSGSKGTANVKFTVTENTDYDDRSVSVTIKAGTASKTFTITQKGMDALLVTTSKYEVAQEGGQIEIEVKANINYQMEISESAKTWITESKSKSRALTTHKHKLDIAMNEEAEKREGEITFKSGDKVETVKVYQAGGAIILLSKNEYTVSDAGETITVDIKSNVEYGVQMPDVDWIEDEASGRGMSSHTLKYVVAANDGYDSRSAEIIFYDKNSELKDTLKVVQAQKDAIVISQKEYDVKAEGETIEVKLSANVDFEVTMPEVDWVTQTKSRGLAEHKIYFKVAENEGEEERMAEIIFVNKDSQLSETIKIIQNCPQPEGYVDGVLTIKTAGTMKKLLGDDYLNITTLKIVGPINGDDIYYLKKMYGDDGNLKDLDLSEATNEDTYGDRMFYKSKLRTVILPKDFMVIGGETFYGCKDLVSVIIPEGVTSIGGGAFQGCCALTTVKIPDSVTSISSYAFWNCYALTTIKIPDNVTSIGREAFWKCSALTTVVMGKNVESVGPFAFYGCSKLDSVYITDLSAWCKIDFEYDEYRSANPLSNYAKLYLNDEELTELVVPKGIKKLGRGAFLGCASIEKVTIGDDLELIWHNAFRGCGSLKEVVIGKNVRHIGEYAFYACPIAKFYSYATKPPLLINFNYYPAFDFDEMTESVLYVPKGCISKYAATEGWQKFKNIEAME